MTFLTAALHAAAAASLLAVLPALPGAAAAILLAVLAAVMVRDRTLLRGPDSVAALEVRRDGSLVIRQRDGTLLPGLPSARRYVSRWLVVLVLGLPSGGTRTILVARDMLGAESFRRLRLWTLWNALPVPAAAASA